MEQTTRVTKENFSKYEQKVCRMERRRREKKAEQEYADIAGGAAFFIATLATLFLADLSNSSYGIWVFLFLVPAIISVAVHLLTVLAVKLTYSAAPDAPLEGSDAERAVALYTRCEKAGYSLLDWDERIQTYIPLSVTYAVLLYLVLAKDILEDTYQYFFPVIIAAIFFLIYAMPNYVLGVLLHRIRHDSDLENDLRVYSELCKKQEQERAEEERRRIMAEENRRLIEIEEQKRQRGDELYRQATAGGAADEALVRRAADLHSRPACLYMGRRLLEKWSTGSYTKAEKLKIAKEARGYFSTASLEEDSVDAKTEARFGYLMCQTLTESGSESKWSAVLSELREIQKSGKLPEQYNEACATLIDSVVDMIDTLAEERASRVYTGTVSTSTWSTSDTGSSSSYTDRYKLYAELDAMDDIIGRMRQAEMSGETPGDAYMD